MGFPKFVFAALFAAFMLPVSAKEAALAPNTVVLAALPQQGQEIYRAVQQGGPFAYPKDGVVFANRERLLPTYKRGYYHEYTVKTPGTSNRGARRLVCGGPKRMPDACYYSDDHYASFRRVVP